MPTAPDSWLQRASSLASPNPIHVGGDSYAAGGAGSALQNSLRTATGRVVINTGLGGSTLAAVLERILAAPYLIGMTTVIWDGSANGYGTVMGELAIYDQIIQVCGRNKLLIIPSIDFGPSTSSTPSAYALDRMATRDGLRARGVAVLDAQAILAPLNDGSAGDLQDVSAGVVPRSCLADGVHLAVTPMNAVATSAASLLVARSL